MKLFEKWALPQNTQRQPKVLEHETKFVFLNHHLDQILSWVTHTCQTDPAFPHNIIASIYYDTRCWKFLREKVDSDYLKTKVRVRWYRNPGRPEPQGNAFIEVKSKIGAPRTKFRMESPYPANWLHRVPLEDLRLLEIPRLLKAHCALSEPTPIFPAFIVQYERYRFIEPISGTRICIDCNIHVPKVNGTMLGNPPSSVLHTSVLEVKGDFDGLPGMLSKLFAFGVKKSSFSKYLACYQKLQRIKFH